MHNHQIDFGQRTEFRTVLNNIDAAETIKSIPTRYNGEKYDVFFLVAHVKGDQT